jgi:hypothetical protein
VAVTAAPPVLQVEASSLANVVGEHEIRALPLNGRNFQQLGWLAAGVMPSTTASSSLVIVKTAFRHFWR